MLSEKNGHAVLRKFLCNSAMYKSCTTYVACDSRGALAAAKMSYFGLLDVVSV